MAWKMEATRKSESLQALIAEHLALVVLGGLLLLALATWLARQQATVEVPDTAAAPPVTLAPSPRTVFPDLSLAASTGARKEMFLDYLQDYIDDENQRISFDRLRLIAIGQTLRGDGALIRDSRDWLLDLADRYEVAEGDFADREAWLEELLFRVDVVPTSLALAQAANESAWGTSRFTREGNNIFGQWCHTPGCGIVPRLRPAGATHEVRSFTTIHDAMAAYFININTNEHYQFFRELRQTMKLQQRDLDPLVLAFGLNRYSQRGRDYVDELQTIIVQNDLMARDADYHTTIGMID